MTDLYTEFSLLLAQHGRPCSRSEAKLLMAKYCWGVVLPACESFLARKVVEPIFIGNKETRP